MIAIPRVSSHFVAARRGRLLLCLCALCWLFSAISARAQAPEAQIHWSQTHATGIIAYSPAQSLLAVAQGFGEIALLQPDGTVVQTITSGQAAIFSLAFTPDGQTLVSGGMVSWKHMIVGNIKLWRVSDGTCLQTITYANANADAPVLSVAITPDGQTLASGNGDGTFSLWRVSDGACLQTLNCTASAGSSVPVAFSPDGQTLATGSSSLMDSNINLWRVSDGACLLTITNNANVPIINNASVRADIFSLAFSPDGQTLASGTWNFDVNGNVNLWRVSDGACLQSLYGDSQYVTSVAFSPDGQTLASAGDGYLNLWSVSDGACLQTITSANLQQVEASVFFGVTLSPGDGANYVAFAPDGQSLASGCGDCLQLWQVSDGACLQTFTSINSCPCVAYAPDGQTLATISNYSTNSNTTTNTINIWSVNDGSCLQTITDQRGVCSIAFAPDGLRLASGNNDGTITIWCVSDGACLHTLTGNTSSVTSIAFSPDGQTLAASNEDEVNIWRVSDGACLQTLAGSASAMAFSPDGQTLATGSGDGVNICRVSDGAYLQNLCGNMEGDASSVAFSPDGQVLAAGSSIPDASVELWCVSNGAHLLTLNDAASPVAFSPDGQTLASGSEFLSLTFWRVSDGACLQTLTDFTAPVTSVAFAPDGQTLATGGGDGVALWSLTWPLSAVTLTPSPAYAQPVNTPITLTAAATGGTNVQYQFWAYNPTATPAWSQLQAYSASATCIWTPSTTGSYLLSATAQDGNSGTEVNTTLWYTITVATPLTVTASLPSPQPVNTPIPLTAVMGGANVQYQFWAYNPNTSPAWNQLQACSSSATCTWTPTTAGDYLLSVSACGGSTGAVMNTTTLCYAISSGSPLTAVTVTPAQTSPQTIDTQLTFSATATGGTNVRYQFWLYNPSATPAWSQLQAYSSQANCMWIPTTAGAYLLSISACDGITGAEVNTTLWYTIVNGTPLTAVSVTSSPTPLQVANTPITLTATATGGTNVRYQFWLYNPAATPAWSQLQAYSTSATCTWTPTALGDYLLSVTACDDTYHTEVNTTLWYNIPPLTSCSLTTSPDSTTVNTPVTLSAMARGGLNDQYQFWVYNQNATPMWTQLQAYSSQATCTWTPTVTGNYLFSATVQDGATGTEVNTTCWFYVN